MARVVALDEIEHKLKQHILNSLRTSDEAMVLPQAHVSPESGTLKNVVMRLCGSEPGLNPDIFSPMWFSGVSVISVSSERAESLLSSDAKRREMILALAKSVPSEMQDTQIQVGPCLDGDEEDRDTDQWIPGFDGPGCCVGLYSSAHSRAPEAQLDGMSRVHNSYFLVCKAGAGLAGQTFHARLSAALRSGSTLDEALSDNGTPGTASLCLTRPMPAQTMRSPRVFTRLALAQFCRELCLSCQPVRRPFVECQFPPSATAVEY